MARVWIVAAMSMAGVLLAGGRPAGGGGNMKTEEEWKRILTPEQYRVMRLRDTELACSGPYWDHHDPGTYACSACGAPLFASKAKFESGTGWPSYTEPVSPGAVGTERDTAFGMVRTEVHCAACGGHLGHVFEDGPQPSGLRYCINSVSLKFVPAR